MSKQVKWLVSLLLSALLAVPAKSQVLMSVIFGDKLNSKELSFGLHANYSWNTLSATDNQKALTSFNFGLFFTYHFNQHWHANLEMLAKYKRGADGLSAYDLQNDSLNNLFKDGNVKRQIGYLSLPMTIQYMFDPGIYLELGPQFSLRTKAKDIFSTVRDEGELQLERDIEDNINRWDIGWLGGIGYKLGKAKLIAVGLRYYGGFSDVVKNEQGKQFNQQWGIYTNIPIGVKKAEARRQAKAAATQ